MRDAVRTRRGAALARAFLVTVVACFLLGLGGPLALAHADEEATVNEYPMQEGASSLMKADASFYAGNYTGNPTSSTGGYSQDYKGPTLWDVVNVTGSSSATCITDHKITTSQWQDAYGNWGLHGSWYNNSMVKPICDDFATTKNFTTLEYNLLQKSNITWDEPQWINNLAGNGYEVFRTDTGSGEAIAYPLTNDEVLHYKNAGVECISDCSYWTRTPETESLDPWSEYSYLIERNWTIKTGLLETSGVRPAASMDLSDVLLVSAAYTGKASGEAATYGVMSEDDATTLTKVAASNEPSKLTLHDESRDGFSSCFWKSVSSFDGSISADSNTPISTADKFAICYSGATVGENNYVSAILKDSDGNIVYYERLVDCNRNNESGIVWFRMPDDLASGTYTLGLFSENCTGNVSESPANIVGGRDQYSTESPTDISSAISYTTLTVESGVEFDPNGADQPTEGSMVSGSKGDIILTPSASWATRTGYSLVGWNTKADGTGKHYDCAPENASVDASAAYAYTLKNGDIETLYAEWEPNTYQITFEANAGSGTMTSQTMTYGEANTLTSCAFTAPNGKRFSSWNTEADGSGTKYSNRQSVLNLSEGDTITLYAQWEDDADVPIMYTLAFGELYTKYEYNSTQYTPRYPTAYVEDWVTLSAPTLEEETGVTGKVRVTGREWITSVGDAQGASVSFTSDNGGGTHFAGWYKDRAADGTATGLLSTDMTYVPSIKDGDGKNPDYFSCYAIVESNTCHVAFDKGADDATGSMDTMNVVYRDGSTVPECSYTRPGCTFTGWSASDGSRQETYQPGDKLGMIDTSNTDGTTYTLTAMWKVTGGTLYYNLNASDATGSIPSEWHQATSTCVLASGNSVSRVGYILDSWKSSPYVGAEEWAPYGTYVMPAQDVTLYAGWKERDGFKLVVDANGGSFYGGSTQRSRDVSWTTSYLAEGEVPSRVGYQFVQYNTPGSAASAATEVTYDTRWCDLVGEDESIDVATIYAVWSANNYHIEFDGNSSEATGSMYDQYFYYGTPDELRSCGFTRPGYTFIGWSTDKSATSADYADGATVNNLTSVQHGTVILYAVWSKDPNAAVAYKAVGDGTANPASESLDPVTDDAQGSTAAANAGSHFVDWTSETTGDELTTDSKYTPSRVGGVNVSGTYDANFKSNAFHIIFDAGAEGVTGTMGNLDVTYGTKQNLPACAFERSGYTFTGWSASEGAAQSSYADMADVSGMDTSTEDGMTYVLTAQWESNSRTLSFDSNGGTGTVDSQNHDKGTQVILPDGTGFSRDGYVFMGWSETANGALAFSAGDSYTMPAVDTTLYACWKPCEYTVSFDKNAEDATGTMADQTVVYGVDEALSANCYSRDGFTFAGWSTDSSSSEVSYANGAMVKNLSSDDGGRVTLYAVWTKDTDGDAETDAKTDAKTDSDGGDAASGIAIPISSEDGDVLPMTGDMNATSVAAIIGLAGLAVMLVSFAVRKRTGSR